jgi:hypothetical protein
MFKKILRIAGASALLVGSAATMAANAVFSLSTTTVTYASEIFGTGSDATQLQGSGTATLTVTSGQVDDGAEGTLKFTLTNATFGNSLLPSDLAFVDAGAQGDTIKITIQSGGQAGDGWVTFLIVTQADGNGDSAVIETTDTLALTIPNLQGASALADSTKTVTIAASFTPTASSGTNDFTNGATAVVSNIIAASADDLTLTNGNGTNDTININSRTDLVTGLGTIDHDNNGGTAARDGLVVGVVTITQAGVPVDETHAVITLVAADKVGVTVTGNFRTNDIVFLDLNANSVVNTGEALTMNSATQFSGSFSGAALPAAANVIYVPNKTTDLAPGSFSTTLKFTYDPTAHPTYRVPSKAQAAATTITYSGLFQDGWTSAVPASTQSDIANIRVTNETAGTVDVFSQCYGQDGTNLGFYEIITDMPGYSTSVLSAADLEAKHGMWTGRARCDFSVSGNVSVQTLIRTGGVLNNMSALTGTSTTSAYDSDGTGTKGTSTDGITR